MITKKFCSQQIDRLRTVPLYVPRMEDDKAATVWLSEWLNVLMRNCQSNEHAQECMSKFLTETIHCENPIATFVAIAKQTAKADEPPPGCDVCYLTPDVNTGAARWAAHAPVFTKGYESAARCSCARGQWLAKKDAERIATAARQKERGTNQLSKVEE